MEAQSRKIVSFSGGGISPCCCFEELGGFCGVGAGAGFGAFGVVMDFSSVVVFI